jgi:acyl-coenzyme A thioesterase PaaI-like protein
MPAAALSTWNRLRASAAGRWLFSRAISFKAPYFATIRPTFLRLEPGTCEVALRKRRAVLNHIGTVHAIAMCNLAELAGGLVTEVTLPDTHRWIPKGMRVDYLAVAKTDLVATARCILPPALADLQTLEVPVEVRDADGATVFRALIEMHVSKRRPFVARDSRRS